MDKRRPFVCRYVRRLTKFIITFCRFRAVLFTFGIIIADIIGKDVRMYVPFANVDVKRRRQGGYGVIRDGNDTLANGKRAR